MFKFAKELIARARRRIKQKNFALPGEGEGPEGKGPGSYPIHDLAHARNALARASQQLRAGNLTPEQYRTILRRVYKKYPGLRKRKEEREGEAPEVSEEK